MTKLTPADVHTAYVFAVQRPGTGPKLHETPEDWQAVCRVMAAYLNVLCKDVPSEPQTDKHAIVQRKEGRSS